MLKLGTGQITYLFMFICRSIFSEFTQIKIKKIKTNKPHSNTLLSEKLIGLVLGFVNPIYCCNTARQGKSCNRLTTKVQGLSWYVQGVYSRHRPTVLGHLSIVLLIIIIQNMVSQKISFLDKSSCRL